MKFLLRLIFLNISTLISINTMAQLSLGGRAGANVATVSVSNNDEADPKSIVGLSLAFIADIAISENLSIQAELAFIQKGFRIEEVLNLGGEPILAQSDFIVNQIDVPVLAKYSVLNKESIVIRIAGGPVIGYALGVKFRSIVNGNKTSEKIDWDNIEYNRFEVGASVGTEVGFIVGSGSIILDARYVFGLSNLFSGDDDRKVNNRGIGVSVGYVVPLKQ